MADRLMPADLTELRRLHEEYVKAKSALKPKSSAGHLTYDMAKNALVVASLDTMPELLDRLEAAEAENAELKGAIERDRTTLADFVTRLKSEMDSRFWLTEGRGSYAWNDDRYRDEFRSAAVGILDAIKPLVKMAADLKNSPRDSESVRAARRDLEAENARLRENGLRLVKALDRIDNHACSGEAQYGCRYCSKSGDIAREALGR